MGTDQRHAMLNKLYIDNYRCFQGFSLEFERTSLILGQNGVGKSSIVDVLCGLQSLCVGSETVGSVFPLQTASRWQ